MADGFLPIPQDFHDPDDPLWADPAWLGAYVHLQMASCWGIYHVEHNGESYRLKPGQLLFSQRRFAEEVGWGRTRTRSFIQHLEERDLISYPNGRNHQGSYIVQLTDCWYLREGGVPPTVPRDPENRTTRFSPKPPILREIEEGGSENRTTRSRKPYHQPCHEIPVYLQKGWGAYHEITGLNHRISGT